MEHCLAIKENKILIHTIRWMDLKTMLSERKQTQKTTYHLIPFYEILGKVKSILRESRSVVARDRKSEHRLQCKGAQGDCSE